MSKVITDRNKIKDLLDSRYLEAVFPSKERASELMESGNRLSFYLGIDPTGPDIHLGHTTNLFVLNKLANLGHKIILLIGNFTAMIGDPTGKDTARKVLSEDDIKENMKTYVEQVCKILPKKSFEIKYNGDWYKKMKVEEFIKLTSRLTVQQMITRDMFQRRLKEEKPISLHEFLYPLLQGYDSVAMKVDGEIGGNDQTFNMLVGRDLTRHILGKDKIVIATKLLEDSASGKKIMNKSEGSYVAVNYGPDDMFGKVMAMPDSVILPLFGYATEVSDVKIDELKSRLERGENPMLTKKELAGELVKMYHGEKAAEKAKENFEKVFSEGQEPKEKPEINSTGSLLRSSILAGIVPSASEFKRLVEQGGIKINGEMVTRWDQSDKPGDDLKVGSHKYYKIK